MYIELKNIEKSFGDYKACDCINLSISKGTLAALLGPSGSGKTTLLRMIAGFITPDAGDININGNRVNDTKVYDRGIGFVFQNYALFRYMTVYENIAFGLEVKKMSKRQIRDRVMDLIELTGLKGMEKRYPSQMSGGQRQRVAFARSLAPNPGLLLLDEPFAAIDAKVRQELRFWLKDMIHKVGITSIFVTHDQDEAVEVADEIIVTSNGRIEQTGSPLEIYKNPKTTFVAEFIGQSERIFDFHRLKGFDKQGFDGAVIRPEFVETFKRDNEKFQAVLPYSEEGIVEEVSFLGTCLKVRLRVNGIHLTTHRSLERRSVSVGETMHVIVYRIYAYKGEKACYMENSLLKGKEIVAF